MSLRVIDPNSTQKKKEEESTNAPLNPTVSGGAGSTASTSQAPTSQNQRPVNAAAPSSGSFTDLSKYKQAASTAGDRLSQGINRTISTNLNKGESSLNTAKKDFQSNVDKGSGYAATDEGRRQAIANVAGYTSSQSGLVPVPTNNLNQQTPQINNEFGEKDFSDVINKKYGGITSANQLESYAKAKQDASNVSNYNKLVEDRNKATDLMGRTFANRGDAYTQGMASLDSYLYNKSGAAGNVKAGQPFQNAANFQNTVSDTEKGMSGYVTDRTKQIEDMRNAARSEFSNVANQRTGQVEDRLNNVRNNWDNLTNMLRSNFIDPKTGETIKGDVEVDPLTARMLQMRGGSQLFNLTKDRASLNDFIKSREFERDRLIGSGEQQNLARLEALSRLAKSPGMEYTNKYYDASRAGTLSARDSVDQENVRRSLENAMLGFQENALKDQTGTGVDTSYYKRLGQKNKWFNTHASGSGNLASSLDKSGYKYEVPTYDENFIGNDADYENYKYDLNAPNMSFDLPSKTKQIVDDLRKFTNSIFTNPGNIVSTLLGDEYDRNSRINESQARSNAAAATDLVNKLKNQLQTEGFYNNAMTVDPAKNEDAKRRYEALKNMLASLDDTNVGNY
jgi:hypothetical protein